MFLKSGWVLGLKACALVHSKVFWTFGSGSGSEWGIIWDFLNLSMRLIRLSNGINQGKPVLRQNFGTFWRKQIRVFRSVHWGLNWNSLRVELKEIGGEF